jgi:predicted permease
MAGRLISIIVTPIYTMALIGVLMGKRIHFKVTPKGNKETNTVPIKIFFPQLILGTISLAGIIYGQETHHTARILIFWASLSVVLMYSSYIVPAVYSLIKNTWIMKVLRFRPSIRPIIHFFTRRNVLKELELNR